MKKVIIIGAGISGLSAGIFARLHGFDTEIYELHSIPGGECTGWSRQGYHFDNCIHWLTGTLEGTDMYKVWDEIGAFKDTEIYTADYYCSFTKDDCTLYAYRDLDKFKAALIEVAPEDAECIERFITQIKVAQETAVYTQKPWSQMNVLDMMKMAKKYKNVGKYMKEWNSTSVADYIKQFKSPILKEFISTLIYNESPVGNMMFMLGAYSSGNGGWPIGGSLALSQRLEKRYKELGGKVYYKKKAEEILVEDGKVKGMRLKDGSQVYGDYMISTVDGLALINHLLKDYCKDDVLHRYEDNQEEFIYPVSVEVSVGVKCDLSHRSHQASYPVEPFRFGNQTIHSLGIKHYCIEKEFAPEGCSSLKMCLTVKDLNYWQDLKRNDKEAYYKEKQLLGAEISKRIEIIYPETKGLIEVVDISTPATYERYCDAYKGCWMTPMPKTGIKGVNHKGRIDGVKNLYLGGQWVASMGGLPTAALAGKWAVQKMCKDEKIKFKFDF